MAKMKIPNTTGLRFLKQKGISYDIFQYQYEEKGGTAQTANELNIDEHAVVKSLVFENENKECVIALQHGNLQVSAKELARIAKCKKFSPAAADTAMKWTGYQFGGTSPFGSKKEMQVFAQESLFDLDTIYINGGGRGLIVGIAPEILLDVLNTKKVDITA